MSLIKCPECNREISNQALNCPHCGFSFQNQYNLSEESKMVGVNIKKYERTNKKWKKILLFSVPLLIFGSLLFFVNLMSAIMSSVTGELKDSNVWWLIIGFLSMTVGGILSLVASIGHWWERG